MWEEMAEVGGDMMAEGDGGGKADDGEKGWNREARGTDGGNGGLAGGQALIQYIRHIVEVIQPRKQHNARPEYIGELHVDPTSLHWKPHSDTAKTKKRAFTAQSTLKVAEKLSPIQYLAHLQNKRSVLFPHRGFRVSGICLSRNSRA